MAESAIVASNATEISVTDLSNALRRTLEDRFAYVRVRGEISGYRGPHSSGHVYFCLKDAGARLDAVIWRSTFLRMRIKPEEGLEVVATGKITTFANKSSYQLVVESIAPAGVGALMALLEARRRKLAAEGLFDPARKRLLPYMPRVIGVVTSPGGAVIRDILHRLADRFPVHVLVWPVRVQGETSAAEVACAIHGFNTLELGGQIPRPDVLIVARGGGSIEDLWAFNEEIVVRAIAASEIPVITGIGHETDFTIADFAADVRAPTPSAAAEIVVRSRDEFERHIAVHQRHLIQQMRYLLSQRRHRVRDLQTHRGFRQLEVLVRRRHQQVDDLSSSLAVALRLRIAASQQRLARAGARISSFDLRARATVLRRRIEQQRGALHAAIERLVIQKRRRFNAAHLRFAALDLRARVGKLRQACERRLAELRARMDRLLVARRRRM